MNELPENKEEIQKEYHDNLPQAKAFQFEYHCSCCIWAYNWPNQWYWHEWYPHESRNEPNLSAEDPKQSCAQYPSKTNPSKTKKKKIPAPSLESQVRDEDGQHRPEE